MLGFHLQRCAHSRYDSLHRLSISSFDLIVMPSSNNLFKTKPFSIPSLPTSPFFLQTSELFHSRRVLFSNNPSKPTSNLGPFSLRNSGSSYAAGSEVPPGVSSEWSAVLSARLSVLTKKLTKLGFEDCECMPGQYNHLICPMCKGGHSGEKSLSLDISKDGNSAAWICFLGKCRWQGNTMAFVNANLPNGKMNQTMKAQSSYGELNQTVKAKKRELIEKNLELEPLCDELLAYFAKRMISAQTLQRNHVMQKTCGGQIVIAFTYKRNGALVSCKYRSMPKRFWQESGSERIFYGIDDIQNASDIIIVEGEIDKLSMEEAGFRNCVSVPNGAPGKVSIKDVPAPDQELSVSVELQGVF
uniref:Uncharacterized protein n=1 Tax=Opuntia streptacantha TaxID=393608 RepID=A0A7C8YBZ1_OPUST